MIYREMLASREILIGVEVGRTVKKLLEENDREKKDIFSSNF
jgi:hypothetical protein